INLDRNPDISSIKSFQDHKDSTHDLCGILFEKFHLLLAAPSDLYLSNIANRKYLWTFLFPNEIHSICASSFSTTIYHGTDIGTSFIVSLRTLTIQVN
ncbi:unnamed protein product, partial [Rotaria sordida]